MSWETSFVAMSVALGASPDDALAALGPRAAEARQLAALMKAPSKAERARALAAGLAPLARAVADADLRGGA